MKRKITKLEMIAMIKELDTRCAKWDSAKFDRAIDGGIGELTTVLKPFTSELVVDLADYYEMGETKFSIEIPNDATSVYDLYLVREGKDNLLYKHGEQKFRNENLIYKDPHNIDVVHVDLDLKLAFDNAVVKYFYVPKAKNFEELYISADVYMAFEAAIMSYTYMMLHDVEKSGQNRTAMTRLAMAVPEIYPEDFGEPFKPSMFPAGV